MKFLSILSLLTVGAQSVCLPNTTKNKLDVTTKVWSEDGLGIAWAEINYQGCTNAPCIMTPDGTCPKYWGYQYTLKSAAISATNAVTAPKTVLSGITGKIDRMHFMKQSNYYILQVSNPDNFVMSPSTILVRPDGRTKTLVASFDTSKFNVGDPFDLTTSEVYPSPSGRYYAIGNLPGKGNRSLVLTIFDACTGASLVTQTVANFRPNIAYGGMFRWVSETKITYPESEIFSDTPGVSRVGTWIFDPVAKKTVSNTIISVTTVPTSSICLGSPSTSATISRNGQYLYAQAPSVGCGNSGTRCDNVNNVDASTSWSWFVDMYDASLLTSTVFNCTVAATRGGRDFPAPNIKCDCGATKTSRTTACVSVLGTGCTSGEVVVTSTKCKLGFWDLASTGKVYTCSKMNTLDTCKVTTTVTGTSFNEDEDALVVSDDSTRESGMIAMDIFIGALIVGVLVAAVAVVVIIRRRTVKTTRV